MIDFRISKFQAFICCQELKQITKLLGNVIGTKALNTGEATGLSKVVTDYTYALDVAQAGSTDPQLFFRTKYLPLKV
jgi:hypothetical protein